VVRRSDLEVQLPVVIYFHKLLAHGGGVAQLVAEPVTHLPNTTDSVPHLRLCGVLLCAGGLRIRV
jgi:hypothetical protein